MASPLPDPPSLVDEKTDFSLNLQHGHKDLVQAVAFNAYGDRCATGSVDGKIRVFNRHKDGTWRLCDTWGAHGGEILEVQWLPPTVYPNLVASLGIEGRFKLWAEDPSAAPGRRFSASASSRAASGKAAFETRSSKAPYRSFSLRHSEETRHTHLALLAADGRLTVFENDQPENLAEYAVLDELAVCARPARGEEVAFTVRFDPNPDPCYTALRAGVPTDALGLVVAAMGSVKIYRSREAATAAYGVAGTRKQFYLAAEISGHRGLVRDVAWAPANIRGYDVIATACQDGFVRVFRLETPFDPADGRGWSESELVRPERQTAAAPAQRALDAAKGAAAAAAQAAAQAATERLHQSGLTASLAHKSGAAAGANGGDRHATGQPGQVRHVVREVSRLDSHRTPVWRVDFNDDGQILGSVGDDGKLMCYRQVPDGSWAKSSELSMMKTRMVAP